MTTDIIGTDTINTISTMYTIIDTIGIMGMICTIDTMSTIDTISAIGTIDTLYMCAIIDLCYSPVDTIRPVVMTMFWTVGVSYTDLWNTSLF